MIKAGWFLQFRVYGVRIETLPSSYSISDIKDREAHPQRRVECLLSAEPQIPGSTGQLPVLVPGTIPAGVWEIQLTPPAETEALQAPNVWFGVHATDEFNVSSELERAWFQGEQGARTRLLAALEHELLAHLRPRAELVAGVWSVLFGTNVFAPSISSPTLWMSEVTWICMSSRTMSEVVGPHSLSQEQLATIAAAACANTFAPEVREVEILRRASTWYLRANGETHDSMERFIWFFLSLEALTYLVDQKSDASVLNSYSSLRQAVEDEPPELRAFVADLSARISQAPLGLRFRRLAEFYSAATADADSADFAEYAAIRNKLLHGDYAAHGTAMAAMSLNDRIGRLAFRYLSAIVDRRFRAAKSRIHQV